MELTDRLLLSGLGPDCQEPDLEVLSLHTVPHVLSGAFKTASA